MIRNWPGALSAILTPIPLSIKRLRNRGFNQAELVAAGMAVNLGLAVRTDILVRVKDVSPQTEIKSREKRLMNVKGIFQVRKEVVKAIKNSVIIVADDVSTTGATLNEAVRTLKMGGAKTVYEVSLTR
jgi:ComF family protein